MLKSLFRMILESTRSLGHKAPSLWLKLLSPFVLRLLSSVGYNDGADDEAINAGIYAISRAILTWLLHCFVGRMPPDASLAMKPVGCSCRDCSELNRFLSDGQQRQLKYPAAKERSSLSFSNIRVVMEKHCLHVSYRTAELRSLDPKGVEAAPVKIRFHIQPEFLQQPQETQSIRGCKI